MSEKHANSMFAVSIVLVFLALDLLAYVIVSSIVSHVCKELYLYIIGLKAGITEGDYVCSLHHRVTGAEISHASLPVSVVRK